ncbi:contractile injection system tape measure protein [Photorhabdus africana]|uniref:contractile injection system tape measure protein n=1 Tax=Photorhabdus africana TaxID=3097554 RepID=UPI002B4032A0|nr:contractile injection system tape measure protein [Photorhabdus sp. CRI-LC]
MAQELNLLNRITMTIEANNQQVAKTVLHGSLLNQANINSLFNTFFTQHPINQDIYLETLTLDLGEISLHNFNSVFPRQLNTALSKALNQYKINHKEKTGLNTRILNETTQNPISFGDYSSINVEKFIHTLYQKESILDQMEAITDSKNSDIKHLINQITQIKSKLALLLAQSCLSEQSLKQLLAIKQPALLNAINYRLSERTNRPQHREELISSGQLILNALGYMQRHNTQEIPKPDAKVISRIITELNNDELNATPIIELFHQIITHKLPLNSGSKQLWQAIPVSQLCKKYLSVAEYQYLSEYFISDKLDKNRSDAESASDNTVITGVNNTFITGINNNNPLRTINLPHSQPVLLPESCQVNNAGILILWPMLPTLFNQLDLLKEKKFIHRQAQFDAINSLDYLIWGTEETQTERKVLNNVLCGIMADENSKSTSLEPEKQLIITQWLDVVINQLPGWKKLSRNDARQLFLQRPGELLINEQEIKITVEHQPFDVLLTDWPWPLNIAKFPWLDRPLRIDWQNI